MLIGTKTEEEDYNNDDNQHQQLKSKTTIKDAIHSLFFAQIKDNPHPGISQKFQMINSDNLITAMAKLLNYFALNCGEVVYISFFTILMYSIPITTIAADFSTPRSLHNDFISASQSQITLVMSTKKLQYLICQMANRAYSDDYKDARLIKQMYPIPDKPYIKTDTVITGSTTAVPLPQFKITTPQFTLQVQPTLNLAHTPRTKMYWDEFQKTKTPFLAGLHHPNIVLECDTQLSWKSRNPNDTKTYLLFTFQGISNDVAYAIFNLSPPNLQSNDFVTLYPRASPQIIPPSERQQQIGSLTKHFSFITLTTPTIFDCVHQMTLGTITDSQAAFASIQANLVQIKGNEDPQWENRILELAELHINRTLNVCCNEYIHKCRPRICNKCDTYHHPALLCHHTFTITITEYFICMLGFQSGFDYKYHPQEDEAADIENALFEKYGNFASLTNVSEAATYYYKIKLGMHIHDVYESEYIWPKRKILSCSVKIPNEENSEFPELRRKSTFTLPTKSAEKDDDDDDEKKKKHDDDDMKFFRLDPNSATQIQVIENLFY